MIQEVEDYEELAVDFFDKILNLNYHDCFISNESSLTDFESMYGDDESKEFKIGVIRQIKDFYGVDIIDTYDKFLVGIFDKIKNKE